MQICFLTNDIEKTNEWWSKMTGMPLGEIWDSYPPEIAQVHYRGEHMDTPHKQVIYRYKGTFIELIEPGPVGAWREWIDRHGPGFHHIGFTVPDMDRGLADLEEAGYETIQTGKFPGPDGGPGGRYSYSDTEADGNFIIELLEFTPDLTNWLEEKFPAR
jgi:catechol 2,3-dioxygenase-like lactoylglutathione lyase family enzyme